MHPVPAYSATLIPSIIENVQNITNTENDNDNNVFMIGVKDKNRKECTG